MTSRWKTPSTWIVVLAVGLGLGLRWAFRDYTTRNTFAFVLPWYAFARAHGVDSLRYTFTNYAPLYSYLLIGAAQFDGLAPPLQLIKSISYLFELGMAVMAYRLVRLTGASSLRAALAFAALLLAPTVLYNGALWAEADAIPTFFILVSIYAFCLGRNGVLPFAFAFAAKAQSVFLGPFVLGVALKDRKRLVWLAAIPTVFVVVALPVALAGGPFKDALTVYARQSQTFHYLTLNAANIWMFVPNTYYDTGLVVGLGLAAAAGLALALFIGARARSDPEFLIHAAATSLLLMPFLLPKMLDRFFYGYEIAAIVLAFVNPRFAPFAVMAQVDGVLSYIAFDHFIGLGLSAAVLGNAVMIVFLLKELGRPPRAAAFPIRHWIGYGVLVAMIFGLLFHRDSSPVMKALYFLLVGLLTGQSVALIDRSATKPAPHRNGDTGAPVAQG